MITHISPAVVWISSVAGGKYLWGKTGLSEEALRNAAFDDFGLRNQHIHQVTSSHQVEEEVQVVLVLEAGILANAKRVGCVAGDGLLAHDMLRTLHYSRLSHPLQCILPSSALLCYITQLHLSENSDIANPWEAVLFAHNSPNPFPDDPNHSHLHHTTLVSSTLSTSVRHGKAFGYPPPPSFLLARSGLQGWDD
jgi:hypothetical protein